MAFDIRLWAKTGKIFVGSFCKAECVCFGPVTPEARAPLLKRCIMYVLVTLDVDSLRSSHQ